MGFQNPFGMIHGSPSGAKGPAIPVTSSARLKSCPVRKPGEEGYILLAVLVMVVFVLIALAVAAPKVAADIQRDREVEMVHRGQQYTRAIKMYYKKFGAYPPSLDALEKSNGLRFLRKRYKDPMTGKDDWHLIHFGENKTPSFGFFGQPIGGAGGSTLAGVGPQGATGSGGLFNSNGSSGSSGSIFGSNTGSDLGTQNGTDPNAGAGAPGTDPNAGGNGTNGTNGTSGISGGTSGISGGTNSGGGLFSNSGFGSSSNSSPLTIGGLGIIGVESTSPKLGILEWKKKKHYNEWEFWYDPNADKMMLSNNTGAIGQPAGANGSGGFGNSNGSPGFGNSNGSSGFGNSTGSPGGTFGGPSQTNNPNPSSPAQPQP